MCTFDDTQKQIHEMIDDLKGLCSSYGLSNQAGEEVVITSVFLYKFLNDKFFYNLDKWAEEVGMTREDILADDSLMDAFTDAHLTDVTFEYKDTIECLVADISNSKFYEKFDDALEDISDKNKRFSITTADGGYKPLFDRICEIVSDSNRNEFAKGIFEIITRERFDFGAAFASSFDFYSSIFEYLIKDYNVAAGKYAEYFTPQAVSRIIAKCLVGMSKIVQASEIADPSGGSGSLVLHLANELRQDDGANRAIIYTQDISEKSTRLLRLNLLLNNMTESLPNVICGDTLLNPAHFQIEGKEDSGLKQFDYMVSNPPFKTDFSSTRDRIETKWEKTDRFFAGIPKIPNTKKESMAIYLPFIQHILYSLKDDGKAAIVVPTGFLTAKSGIEMTIRQKLVDNKWIKGVISMPSNIFANTGTNVSVLFIDKANDTDTAILMDASSMGEKVKEGKNQRTVLSNEEIDKIIDTFIKHEDVEDFSVTVPYDKISDKGCSFSAGQYFEVKIQYVDISHEEFERRMTEYATRLDAKFSESHKLESEIMKQIGGLKV